ncbi:MAG: nitrate reductase molybdenum cofactor assembly chaperone [Rhodocyclaceae bacterium]
MSSTSSTLHFRVLSALLQYPEQALIDALPECEAVLDEAAMRARLAPVLAHLAGASLVTVQEAYVDTFDRGRKYSLHLFEHLHGESRERGPALVDLMQAYQREGFDIDANELPDYLPLFLEFLGSVPAAVAQSFLDEAIHIIGALGERLRAAASPYACVFDLLVSLASIAPQPLQQPPVRDMDEAMETFGPTHTGMEPLLKRQTQAMTFYPQPPRQHAPHEAAAHAAPGMEA